MEGSLLFVISSLDILENFVDSWPNSSSTTAVSSLEAVSLTVDYFYALLKIACIRELGGGAEIALG